MEPDNRTLADTLADAASTHLAQLLRVSANAQTVFRFHGPGPAEIAICQALLAIREELKTANLLAGSHPSRL